MFSFTTQKDNSSEVSLHRKIAHLGFSYTGGQFIFGFTTQKNSSSAVYYTEAYCLSSDKNSYNFKGYLIFIVK